MKYLPANIYFFFSLQQFCSFNMSTPGEELWESLMLVNGSCDHPSHVLVHDIRLASATDQDVFSDLIAER